LYNYLQYTKNKGHKTIIYRKNLKQTLKISSNIINIYVKFKLSYLLFIQNTHNFQNEIKNIKNVIKKHLKINLSKKKFKNIGVG